MTMYRWLVNRQDGERRHPPTPIYVIAETRAAAHGKAASAFGNNGFFDVVGASEVIGVQIDGPTEPLLISLMREDPTGTVRYESEAGGAVSTSTLAFLRDLDRWAGTDDDTEKIEDKR